MIVHTEAPPPLLIFIGAAFLCGAAVLVWLSSPSTLMLTRVGPAELRADVEERLFGLIATQSLRYDGIRGVKMVGAGAPDSGSRTSTAKRMVFETATGAMDPGHPVQRFSRHFPAIRDFAGDPSSPKLSLSSLIDGWEVMRFWAAQVGALFLAALGVLVLYLGVRALFPDPDAGIGPV